MKSRNVMSLTPGTRERFKRQLDSETSFYDIEVDLRGNIEASSRKLPCRINTNIWR